jgi:ABC-type sugar transport system ATPase subunit
MNMLKGVLRRPGGDASPELADGAMIALPRRPLRLEDGMAITLGVRPEHVVIGGSDLAATVESTEVLGSETVIYARLGSGHPFLLSRRGISGVKPGDAVPIGLPEAFVHIFDRLGVAVGATPAWRDDYVG